MSRKDTPPGAPASASHQDRPPDADASLAAADVPTSVTSAAEALLRLGRGEQVPLAAALAHLLQAVAEEAHNNERFARAVGRALASAATPKAGTAAGTSRRRNRRAPGVLDPFAVMAEGGEPGLRQHLLTLDLEQLRDIVAEHGMDHDRLALRWKDEARVVDRIVDKVHGRNSKGSAFRT